VSLSSFVSRGSILNAYSVINPDVEIGIFNMIHTKVSIDHDSMTGPYCNIGPGVTICGHVKIGNFVVIGSGVVVTKGITIGNNSIIGAGSVVLNDIPDNVVAYGNPCKVIRENK